MGGSDETVRIYVGTDRSQRIGLRVLEYSIRRFTDLDVEVRSLEEVQARVPRDPRNRQRTGFSFSRFAIPKLAGYSGRAIYMDADMQVFRDIRELWTLPANGAHIVCQEELPTHVARSAKLAAPQTRTKQCSVMLLDCGALDWDLDAVVRGLDGEYDYAQLMQQLCIVPEDRISYSLPLRWNSLEHYDKTTCLIHYTDMPTQPWVCVDNPNGHLWTSEVRRMLSDGTLSYEELEEEVGLGFMRPSFLVELRRVDDSTTSLFKRELAEVDRQAGFVKHAELMRRRQLFKEEIRAFERQLAQSPLDRMLGRRAVR
ncbi:glycosyltransferase [Phenylobacterium sp.]|uniref:glycosyltransferase n=1 Tax=Phenylobacterium sp. TaxID=1871053 RepID=UPI002FC6E5B2